MSSISFVIMSVDPDCPWSRRRAVLWLLPAQEGLDDAHVAAAARTWMLWCVWLLGLSARRSLGAGRLDGIDRNERHGKQLTDTLDILGAGLTGEEAVVADAVEARWQDMHQEAADELAGIERHHPVVSLGAVTAIILPREGDALVVGRDQAAVGDGDAVGVARKIAQDLLRSPEWTLGIDDPVFFAQRCQISREGFWIGQRHVLAEELQLSGTMSGSKLFQDEPSKQTRENLHGEKEVGPAGDPASPVQRDAATRHDHVDMRMVAPTPTIP